MSVVQIGTIFRRKNTKNRRNYPPPKVKLCLHINFCNVPEEQNSAQKNVVVGNWD